MITFTFLLTRSLERLKKNVLLSSSRPKLKIGEKCCFLTQRENMVTALSNSTEVINL